MTTPSAEPTTPPCQCGHSQAAHKDGSENCTRCPSSGIWVDSIANWVFPCEQYQPR